MATNFQFQDQFSSKLSKYFIHEKWNWSRYASLNNIQFQDQFSSKLSRIFLAWKMKLESFYIKLQIPKFQITKNEIESYKDAIKSQISRSNSLQDFHLSLFILRQVQVHNNTYKQNNIILQQDRYQRPPLSSNSSHFTTIQSFNFP